MRPQCLPACLQHSCLKIPSFFLFFQVGLWAEKELMCANTQNSTLSFQKTAVTDCNKRCLLNDMLGHATGDDTSVRHGPVSLQILVRADEQRSLFSSCILSLSNQIKNLYWHEWKLGKKITLSSIFLLHNIHCSNIYIESRVLWLLQKDGTFTWKEGEFV